MSGISEWLATQGLDRYAAAFEAAEIDVDTVPLLTDDDLRELGVPLGPRRKILSSCQSPEAGEQAADPVGERRQITVMFVDLVGSTHLSTQVDPEIMADLLASYKSAVASEVVAAGGTVAKYLGDGVLAYFGWPTAREDAAECAIHCAFEVRDRIKQIASPTDRPLQCRTGIATGLAVVGGTTGSGNAREDAVAGEVLNLAARLQSLADSDGICVSSRVHELVGQAFEFEFAGDHKLRGFNDPVAAWRPTRQAHANRFEAKRAVKRSLVGRQEELAALTARWSDVANGDGGAVLILGDAGIGKSRLLEELAARAGETPHAFVSWQCSAFHQTKPLYPVIERLTRAADILDSDDGPMRLAKLAALLAAAGVDDRSLPLFAALLSIPEDAGYVSPELAPAQRRSATIAAIVGWVRRIAAEKPVLLNLEDAHWSDATTLEVASSLIEGLAGVRLMMAITARPEFTPLWKDPASVAEMRLDRLTDRECEGLIREILAEDDVRRKTVEKILEQSDGNPLYVEELSAALAETGPKGGHAVPDSLQGSLLARLDQLGGAKRTAQLCSVLGRNFARPLLLHLHDAAPASLDSNLGLLVAHDVVRLLGNQDQGRYQFKHALLRDAAYESLLLSERRRLHERCGRQLEQSFPEVAESEPELLAYHFRQAGMAGEAADYLERAGDRASAGAAYIEAIASYRGALDQLAKLPENDDCSRRELVILLKLGPALTIIDGAQGESVREAYQRAERLGRDVGDLDGRFKALWGLWYNANVGRDYQRASDFAEELVLLSEQSHDDTHILEALHCRWSSAMFRGEATLSIRDADRGMGLYRRDRHHRLAAMFGGHDPGVCAYGVAASSQITAGQFDAATGNVVKAVELAQKLDHPHSIAHALMVGLSVTSTSGDLPRLRDWAGQLWEVAERYNFPPQRAVAAFFLEWGRAQAGQPDLDQLREAFDKVVAIGPLTLVYIALQSEELFKAGEFQEALSVIDHFVGALKFPFGYYLPEIYRVRGQCLAALGRHDEANAQLRRSRALAAEQGSYLFALRAAIASMQPCFAEAERSSAAEEARRLLQSIGASHWPEIAAAHARLEAVAA